MEKNYKEKNMFDYTAYNKLMDKVIANRKAAVTQQEIEDAEFTMDTVSDAVKVFGEYVTTVDNTENHIRLAYARYDGPELVEVIQNADRAHRNCHEAAIARVLMLNRLADSFGIEPIFTGDDKDRLSVADFCLGITSVLFQNRKK